MINENEQQDLSAAFGGLINDFDKNILDQDIQEHYGSGSLGDGTPQIYMKEDGAYTFFICPPFEKYTPETPWGGRIGLVVSKHWNIKEEDGKVKGTYVDYETSFPWLGLKSPLKAVIDKWKAKGLATEVESFEPSESVYFNVLMVKSPMKEHQQLLMKVEDGKLVNPPTVCTLESNLTTLKFIQEQLSSEFMRYPITDPIHGTMINIVKGKKSVKGGTRVQYTRTTISHSPMWFEGLPVQEQKEAIVHVLENLPNIYEYHKPNKYTFTDTEAAAKRIDNMLAEKAEYLNNSGAMSQGIPHKDEFTKLADPKTAFPQKTSTSAQAPAVDPTTSTAKETPPEAAKTAAPVSASAHEVFNLTPAAESAPPASSPETTAKNTEAEEVAQANQAFQKMETPTNELPKMSAEAAFTESAGTSGAPKLPDGF